MDTTANWATTRIARNTITRTHVHTGMSENRISTQSEALSGTSTGSGANFSGVSAESLLLLSCWGVSFNCTRAYMRACVCVWLNKGITRRELADSIGVSYGNVFLIVQSMVANGHCVVGVRRNGKGGRQPNCFHGNKGLGLFLRQCAGSIDGIDRATLSRVRGLKCVRRAEVDALLSMLGEQTRDK